MHAGGTARVGSTGRPLHGSKATPAHGKQCHKKLGRRPSIVAATEMQGKGGKGERGGHKLKFRERGQGVGTNGEAAHVPEPARLCFAKRNGYGGKLKDVYMHSQKESTCDHFVFLICACK